jgi:hypothetical protein
MAAVQTFKNLQDQVLAWLDEAGDTGTTLTLVKNALNNANRLRATQERWSWMKWDTPALLTTVVGQSLYTLHSEFFRPDYFWNRTQLDYVQAFNDSTKVSSGADPNNDTGPAMRFEWRGLTEVQNQPTAASVIAVASSSTMDSGSVTVTIKGDTTQGVRSETITAGSSGTVQFTKILKVTKNGTWLGTLTLTSNAAAVTNLTLFPEEYGRNYRQIAFLAIPDQSEVLEYTFYRQPVTMDADNDRPDVPTPHEDILVWDTLLAFSAYNQFPPAFVQLWQQKLGESLLSLQQAEDAQPLFAATNYTTYIPR